MKLITKIIKRIFNTLFEKQIVPQSLYEPKSKTVFKINKINKRK